MMGIGLPRYLLVQVREYTACLCALVLTNK